MKIGIIGAGAMGCIYGMYLSRKHEVLLVDVVKAHVDAINEQGLEFTHLDGTAETVTRLKATMDTSACTAQDIVILLTKGYQSAQALEANRALIGPETIVCSLQNGYGNADDIVKYVPEAQIVLGTSGGGATVAGPGHILHKGQGPTQLGCLTADQSKAEVVARAMEECGVPQVELIPDVKELLWSKLFVNIGINPICALTGELNRSIADNPFSRKVSEMLVREAVDVANAAGMYFDYDDAVAHVIDIALVTGGNVCSMLADVKNGRRTEIDRINGAAVSEAAKLGMKAPLNEMITALIHAKEQTY
ncbi:MAG: 2-dehydropantoate 2-reductase [Oscillospiraceae bacterium]|nr:2-dehydropantoate 2-reductase [Oscillospiraceae bacterium]